MQNIYQDKGADMSLIFNMLLNIKMFDKVEQHSIYKTWSINDGDWGSSKKTTCCADEKSSPTPPAVIPIIATLTWKAKGLSCLTIITK